MFLERAMGIEPTSEAWEASILPLYDARSAFNVLIIHNGASASTEDPFSGRVLICPDFRGV